MPARSESLKEWLRRRREITLTVTGRKSGRAISIPVWFVLEEEKLELLPVTGSDTQWYRNLLTNPTIQVSAGGKQATFSAVAVNDRAQVASIIEKFRAKYGDSGMKWYSKFDVAAVAERD